MRRWYLAGESNATIGTRLGLHQSKVRRVLLEAGVTMRTRRDQVALHDQHDGVHMPTCEEIAAGYDTEGLTIAELAERHQISSTRIALDDAPLRNRATPRRGTTRSPRGRACRTSAARTHRRDHRPVRDRPLTHGDRPPGRRPPNRGRRCAATSRCTAPGPPQAATGRGMGPPVPRWRDRRPDRSHLRNQTRGGVSGVGISRHRQAGRRRSRNTTRRPRRRRPLRRRASVDAGHRQPPRRLHPTCARNPHPPSASSAPASTRRRSTLNVSPAATPTAPPSTSWLQSSTSHRITSPSPSVPSSFPDGHQGRDDPSPSATVNSRRL